MSSIVAYHKNTQLIECDSRGRPIFQGHPMRLTDRRTLHLETTRLPELQFDDTRSTSFRWLSYVLQDNRIRINNIKSILMFLSHELNINVDREYYRRRKSAIYWMEQHLDAIINLLDTSSYTVTLSNGLECPLVFPNNLFHTTT